MGTNKQLLILFSLTVLINSCNNITPAGFWKSFRMDNIETKNSDQGPWGGHLEIRWKSKNNEIFKANQLIDFATNNGWILTDSIKFTADSLSKLRTNYTSNEDYSLEILNNEVLAKLKVDDTNVYRFKTGWIAVKPGNDTETEVNGFVIINSDGTEMTIYHLWGE